MVSAWRTYGASVVGNSHVDRGQPCDDAFAYVTSPAGVLIVVADGAGSRPHSRFGANTAVMAVSSLVQAEITNLTTQPASLVYRAVAAAHTAVASEAEARGRSEYELACTLSVVLLHGDVLVMAHIGDGFVIVQDERGLHTHMSAERPEYVNETTFLTSPGVAEALDVERLDGASVTALAASTDGLRYQLLELSTGGLPYTPFFEATWAWASSGSADDAAVARYLKQARDQTGDDKTLVVAVRGESATHPERARTGPGAAEDPPDPDATLPDHYDDDAPADTAPLSWQQR